MFNRGIDRMVSLKRSSPLGKKYYIRVHFTNIFEKNLQNLRIILIKIKMIIFIIFFFK